MKKPTLIALLSAGVLLSASALAGTTEHPGKNEMQLTKDQIAQIQKDCAKANNGSMTSTAYKECVKTKEDEASAKPKKY